MYLWAKAAHIAAVMVWIAGMFSMAHQLARPDGVSASQWRRLRQLDTGWTVMGMSLAIGPGYWMATEARWWLQPWFVVKFCLAMGLAAAHGGMAKSVRRRAEATSEAEGASWGRPWHRYAPGLLLLAVLLIAALVVVKPGL
jgi:putative membrane protein